MDRPRHDKGTAVRGHGRASGSRDASASEGIRAETGQAKASAPRAQTTKALGWPNSGGEMATLGDSRDKRRLGGLVK